MSEVVRHVIASMQPASAAMAARAEAGPIAAWLAGARHTTAVRLDRRVVLCVACDHAVVDGGVGFGAAHPTLIAIAAIAGGEAALAKAARAAGATVVLVDAGVAEPAHLPAMVIGVAGVTGHFDGANPAATPARGARGRGGDLAQGEALTPLEAVAGLESGIALVTALAEEGLDVLAVGGLGAGGDLAAAAVIAALLGAGDELAPADGRALIASGLALVPTHATPLDVLGAVGGRDLAVLAGALLAAGALHVPIVLDGVVTIAAALLATRLAPALAGYLLSAHGGGGAAAVAARGALGLAPLLSAGLGHGEGTGAAMMLPVLAGAIDP